MAVARIYVRVVFLQHAFYRAHYRRIYVARRFCCRLIRSYVWHHDTQRPPPSPPGVRINKEKQVYLCKVSPAGPDGPPATHARTQYSNAAGSSHGGDLFPCGGNRAPGGSCCFLALLGDPAPADADDDEEDGDVDDEQPSARGDDIGVSQARRRWSMAFQMLSVTSRTGCGCNGKQRQVLH